MNQIPFYRENGAPILINQIELTTPSIAPRLREILRAKDLTANSRKRLEAALSKIEKPGFEF
jgi:hypothetical protein